MFAPVWLEKQFQPSPRSKRYAQQAFKIELLVFSFVATKKNWRIHKWRWLTIFVFFLIRWLTIFLKRDHNWPLVRWKSSSLMLFASITIIIILQCILRSSSCILKMITLFSSKCLITIKNSPLMPHIYKSPFQTLVCRSKTYKCTQWHAAIVKLKIYQKWNEKWANLEQIKFSACWIAYNCTSYQSYDKSQSRSREALEEPDDHGKKGRPSNKDRIHKYSNWPEVIKKLFLMLLGSNKKEGATVSW